ncbi:hypothetical protein LXA43DRAFT_1000390 [Ganoderma leucocontextum]|nr:hypothetical protein LXA43DRAFT_1000390 [Ganoderma leucocontextum]
MGKKRLKARRRFRSPTVLFAALHLQAEDISTAGMREAPVNQLPPELLIRIFSQIDDPCPNASNDGDNWQTIGHGTRWPVVLRVCKYWYDAACDAPLLWQHIQAYTKPDWLRLSLQRSKTALVDVTLRSCQGYAAAIPLLIDHADRLRTLATLDSEHGGFHLLKRLLLLELPNLKELRIAGEEYAEDDDHVNLKPPLGHWPSIRVLRLTHLVLPVKSAIFGSLRVLDLAYMHDVPKMSTMPLDFALTVLEACHELQELKLNGVFPKLVGESEILVSLPHLRRLEVTSHIGPTPRWPFPMSSLVSNMLLRHVQLPLHAALKFVSQVKASTPVGYRSFIPPEDPSYIPILHHATFACLRHDSFLCSEPGGGTLEVTVEFDGEDEPWFNQDRQLVDMSFLLARAPITHLSLVSARLYSESISIAFGTFSGLTTLEFSTVPTHDGEDEDWRFPALFSSLLLPREAHVRGASAPTDESDEEFRARLPLRTLCVLRFNALLWESRVLGLVFACLYARFALGAPRLSELYVAMYGGEAGDIDRTEKHDEEIEMLESLVDGPVVYEDCEPPVSLSPRRFTLVA